MGLGIVLILVGVVTMHTSALPFVVEQNQSMLAIGVAIMAYIFGALIINYELRKYNK